MLSNIICHLISHINLDFYGKTLFYVNYTTSIDNDDQLDQYYVSILHLINIRKKELVKAELYTFLSFCEDHLLPDVENIKRLCLKICESIFISLHQNDSYGVSKYTRSLSIRIENMTTFQSLSECTVQELQHLYSTFEYGLESYSPCIKNALLYISKNYNSLSGLGEVADAVYLNSEYFSRLFKKETGVNFNNYLNNYRLKQSLEYIRFSDMKIYEIAEKVGFTNFSYFSKRFKSIMGITPFEYRSTYVETNNK